MPVVTPAPRIGRYAGATVAPAKRPVGKSRRKPRKLPAPKPAMQPIGLINR